MDKHHFIYNRITLFSKMERITDTYDRMIGFQKYFAVKKIKRKRLYIVHI